MSNYSQSVMNQAPDLQRQSEAMGNPPCIICGRYPFFIAGSRGVCGGHIYSGDGMSEWRISTTCEYCFDEMFAEE